MVSDKSLYIFMIASGVQLTTILGILHDVYLLSAQQSATAKRLFSLSIQSVINNKQASPGGASKKT